MGGQCPPCWKSGCCQSTLKKDTPFTSCDLPCIVHRSWGLGTYSLFSGTYVTVFLCIFYSLRCMCTCGRSGSGRERLQANGKCGVIGHTCSYSCTLQPHFIIAVWIDTSCCFLWIVYRCFTKSMPVPACSNSTVHSSSDHAAQNFTPRNFILLHKSSSNFSSIACISHS